jgi:hypothetical protein
LINLNDYDLIYNQKNLVLHCRKSGSVLSKEVGVCKSVYTVDKKLLKSNITPQLIAKFMYIPEQRLTWDKSLKLFKRLEGNDTAYVIRSWMLSPVVIISEREVIDKRFDFFYEGIYYNISTSVPEKVIK